MPATPRTSRTPAARPAPALPAPSARTVRWEIAIVLGLSLGKSAVYAIVQLIDKATQAPLGEQTTVLNPALADRWAFDLTYQLLGIGFALVPVALVLHLMHLRGRDPFRVLGLDLRRPGRDLAWGLGLFAAIGLGTLGVYAAGRALGITTAIVGSALGESWYQVPVLLLSALRHGLLEEVIVGAWLVDRLGYLQRLRAAGLAHDPAPAVPSSWVSAEGLYLPTRVAVVVLALALLRGAYHLYQGIGPGVGNALMGVVFVLVFLRVRRVMPLVIAPAVVDAGGFGGNPLVARAGRPGGAPPPPRSERDLTLRGAEGDRDDARGAGGRDVLDVHVLDLAVLVVAEPLGEALGGAGDVQALDGGLRLGRLRGVHVLLAVGPAQDERQLRVREGSLDADLPPGQLPAVREATVAGDGLTAEAALEPADVRGGHRPAHPAAALLGAGAHELAERRAEGGRVVQGLDDLQILPLRHGEERVLGAETWVDTALDPLDAQRLGDAGDRGVQALGAGGVGHVVHATGVHCAVPLRSRAAPGVDLVRVGGSRALDGSGAPVRRAYPRVTRVTKSWRGGGLHSEARSRESATGPGMLTGNPPSAVGCPG